jgi:hypothetical protein
MKISEILSETRFDSQEDIAAKQWMTNEATQLNSAIKNFDTYVQVHGTRGANIQFDNMIKRVDESEWYIRMLATNKPELKKYCDDVLRSKAALEEKIKNSGGLSY